MRLAQESEAKSVLIQLLVGRNVFSGAHTSGANCENLVDDTRLYSCAPGSRCHCSQWLLLLRVEGVNWVWFIWADRGPSVPSGLLVFVSRAPVDTNERLQSMLKGTLFL